MDKPDKTTPSKAPGAATTSAKVNAAQVAKWLDAHPDFFQAHHAVLPKLNLPSDAGTAISLHQYQVRLMREEKKNMDAKLALLVRHAKTNHKINQDLLGLAAKLIRHSAAAGSKNLQTKSQVIAEHFGLAQVSIIDLAAKPLIPELDTALHDNSCLCDNKPNQAVLNYLFTKEPKDIQSYAVVSLQKQAKRHAIIALGATDPGRFTAKMGDEFLKQLGGLVQELV